MLAPRTGSPGHHFVARKHPMTVSPAKAICCATIAQKPAPRKAKTIAMATDMACDRIPTIPSALKRNSLASRALCCTLNPLSRNTPDNTGTMGVRRGSW